MTRRDDYRTQLQAVDPRAWDDYLVAESALPGPRANLELAQAAADVGNEAQFAGWLNLGPEAAPEDSATLFLPVCGAIGLGRLISEGRTELIPRLRIAASDPRWRVREAVVLGLQRLGDRDLPMLTESMRDWVGGGWLEQRAAAAALCEPRLLRDPETARVVLAILDQVTRAISSATNRRAPELRVLRQALGYCWSVLIAALPAEGMLALERWAASSDSDIRWIVRENLRKSRLRRMNPEWVDGMTARISSRL